MFQIIMLIKLVRRGVMYQNQLISTMLIVVMSTQIFSSSMDFRDKKILVSNQNALDKTINLLNGTLNGIAFGAGRKNLERRSEKKKSSLETRALNKKRQ